MTDGVVVGVIEQSFIPLLVVNNKAGDDARWLKHYKEAAWNYQVLRFFDGEGKELIPRKEKVWTKSALLPRLEAALVAQDKKVPAYLSIAISEQNKKLHKKVAIAQHCFWTGEALLGRIEGVVSTEAGWYDGKEVTLLTYDSGQLGLKSLIQQALKLKCASHLYVADGKDLKNLGGDIGVPAKTLSLLKGYKRAKVSDQKKQIEGVNGLHELSPAQLTKFNAWWRKDKKKALGFLPPSLRSQIASPKS